MASRNGYTPNSDFKVTKVSNEPVHEISNNVVCATSKASDQAANKCSLIKAFASRLKFYKC